MPYLKRKLILAVPIIAICLAIGLFATAYITTLLSHYSMCLPSMTLSSGKDKLRESIGYLRRRNIPYVIPKTCCEISKGKGEYPALGWAAYFLQGKSHYVFIPKYYSSDKINGKYSDKMWNVVTVNSCGKPTGLGVDL